MKDTGEKMVVKEREGNQQKRFSQSIGAGIGPPCAGYFGATGSDKYDWVKLAGGDWFMSTGCLAGLDLRVGAGGIDPPARWFPDDPRKA